MRPRQAYNLEFTTQSAPSSITRGLRRRHAFAIGVAATSGLFAAIIINDFTSSQIDLARRQFMRKEPAPVAAATTTVLVANEDLAFGSALKMEKLKEVQWPAENVPQGAYKSLKEFFSEQENRVVIDAMRRNEPVLTGRVTGPGQRPGLATMLENGKKAVSIRVNDVVGVSGFLLPGDFADILLTQTGKEASDSKNSGAQEAYTSLLLANVRVLAVDQTADPGQATPKVARTVTVEATLTDSQKITLASTVGSLSFVLRRTGGVATVDERRPVTFSELAGDNGDNKKVATFEPTIAVAVEQPKVPVEQPTLAKINIVRSTQQTEYSVVRINSKD